jgi:hypothetical protein
MSRARFTADEILAQLDDCAREFTFPMLDNGYVYPGDIRLTAYRDRKRWAILIDALGFSFRGGLPHGITTCIYQFGNCVKDGPGMGEFIHPLDYDEPEDEELEVRAVPPGVTKIYLRGVVVPIPRDPAVFAAKGIVRQYPVLIRGEELMRVLLPEHREQLLATEKELRRWLPAKLPFFVRLDEWRHPDLIHEELPSETETFQKLAEALVEGDPNRLLLKEAPNTHWKHWPFGGTL